MTAESNLTTAIEAAASALLRANETSSEYHNDNWTWRDFEQPARAAIEAALPHLRAWLAGGIQGLIDEIEVPEEWEEAIGAFKDALVIVRGEVGDGR